MKSVSFKIDNGATFIDNTAPYTVCGEETNDPCDSISKGTHSITIRAFAGANGTGSAGAEFTRNFNKIDDPLPVTIISFSGSAGSNGVNLVWKTADELNFDRFEVQSSTDGKNWGHVTSVKGSKAGSYSATVPATANLLYFRLKMIDLDGTFEYSKIISIRSTNLTSPTTRPTTTRPVTRPVTGPSRVIDASKGGSTRSGRTLQRR